MNKTTFHFLFATLFLLIASQSAFAQNEPPGYKHLQPIESFIGIWKARFDPPGDVPIGDLEIEFKWMGNKSYIQMNVRFQPDEVEGEMNPEFMVVGYDTEASTTKAWHFKYLDQGRTDAAISRDRLVVHQQEGKPGDADYRMQEKTYEAMDDNLIIRSISRSGDSEPVKEPTLRLSRK